MRIILSRKGLDSGNSKASNLVIMDDTGRGKIYMIPIPYDEKSSYIADEACYNNIHFSKDKNTNNLIKNYLSENGAPPRRHCHADPNISDFFNCNEAPNIPKPSNYPKFLGSVGQIKASQTHLENEHHKVKENDLFIFFGRFSFKKAENNELITIDQDKHLIFGYLQIGEIIYPQGRDKERRAEIEQKYPWIKLQPHWNAEKYKDVKNNCIYVAREKCTFDDTIKGYGMFDFKEDLILTAKDKSLSKWNLPPELKELKISYHSEKSDKGDYFQSTSRGQEFVIEESKQAEQWAINLIKEHTKN